MGASHEVDCLGPEIRKQPVQRLETVGRFHRAEMFVVAFSGFVVVAQCADFIDD
jgi:hypothetical protein